MFIFPMTGMLDEGPSIDKLPETLKHKVGGELLGGQWMLVNIVGIIAG